MQSLPLESKERMSNERIRAWYESWKKYIIYDSKTGKTRFITHTQEPDENGCFVKKKKKNKATGEMVDVETLIKGTKLKPTEYIELVEDGQVYVSFSGGKDSTVLADLCARFCKKYGYTLYLFFANTGLEYPEIQRFVETFAEWLRHTYKIKVVLDKVRPEMRFDQVLKEYGYPVISKNVSNTIHGAKNSIRKGKYSLRLRHLGVQENEFGGLDNNGEYDYEKAATNSKFNITKYRYLLDADFDASDVCCEIMKKRPARAYEKQTGRKAILGTMAHESMLRKNEWIKNGCNAFEKKNPTSQPISSWTNQDILHYIKKYNIPYCSVYGEIKVKQSDGELDGQLNISDFLGYYEPEDVLETTGCSRTGCIFCMFGCHREKEPNRFQRMKETHPRQYEYCINGGEYITEGYAMDSSGEWKSFVFEQDDGTPFTQEEIEEFINEHKDNENFKFVRKWKPNKDGLGLGKVLDHIGIKYK